MAPSATKPSPTNSLSMPGHDAQQRRFAGAVDAEHADLGVRVEGEVDVLQDLLAAGLGLGQALHVIDELARGHADVLDWLKMGGFGRGAYQGREGDARRGRRRAEGSLRCKSWDLALRTVSDPSLHSMASRISEAEKDLSMTRASLAGVSGILVRGAGFPSGSDEAFAEHDGELGLCLGPFAGRHFPFLDDLAQDQEDEFRRRLIVRKMTSGPHGPSELGVQGLDCVRGVDDFPDGRSEGEERDDLFPLSPPDLADRRVFAAP